MGYSSFPLSEREYSSKISTAPNYNTAYSNAAIIADKMDNGSHAPENRTLQRTIESTAKPLNKHHRTFAR